MTTEDKTPRRRRSPISDSLGVDLHNLGTLLANHTRGLDDYLNRQSDRIERRQNNLLEESAQLFLSPGLELDSLTTTELHDICRKRRLKRWSKLRRADLIAFLQEELGPELYLFGDLSNERLANSEPEGEDSQTALSYPRDASRSERLLLLVLSKLEVSAEELDAAWQGSM